MTKKKEKPKPQLYYIVVFENEASISVPADSKNEAIEKAISAVEKLTGQEREDLVGIKEVIMCH